FTSVRPPILPKPGPMSVTISVPASVPSLFQSSVPWTPSSAVKNSMPLKFVKYPGYELLGSEYWYPEESYFTVDPGLMSFTNLVPPPSLANSSIPKFPSAPKNSVPLKLVSPCGENQGGVIGTVP